MPNRIRPLLALCAFFVPAGIVVGCGGVPGNSVAKVNGSQITKADFSHWLQIAVSASTPVAGGAKPPAPDPPKFTKCIAYKKSTAPKLPQGAAPIPDSQYKGQCQTQYGGLRDQVMQFLISASWVQGEAADQRVKVSDADVQKQFQQTKQQSGANFQKLLDQTGMSVSDLLFRIKLNLLSSKIRMKVTGTVAPVTEAQISAYYKQNQARFAQPERRDLAVVQTKTEANAKKALAALSSHQSFSKVVNRFSVDAASKATHGSLPGVTRGQQEKSFDDAIFAASKGKLVGPIKTQFGFYVFKVTAIHLPSQQTLAQAHDTIKQLLVSQGQQTTLRNFVARFRKKWTARTDCQSGFAVMDCSNAPKSKTTRGATPGSAPPSGAPPQQGAPPAQGSGKP